MKVLLDTGVVSELMKSQPDSRVLQFFNDFEKEELYFSVIGESDIYFGLLEEATTLSASDFIPLLSAFEAMLRQFDGRILAFDRRAARLFGEIHFRRGQLGKPIGDVDCQIAAIAYANDMPLVTRNSQDFEATGVKILNPWQ